MGTRHPLTTSYDEPTHNTQAGGHSGPDDKSSHRGTDEILSNILPGHASVTDAVTRLQRERDLALRRVDELHDHYKKRAFLESLKSLMRLGNLLVTKT